MRDTHRDSSSQRVVAGLAGGSGGQSGVSNGVGWSCVKSGTGIYLMNFDAPKGLTIVALLAMAISNSNTYAAIVGSGYGSVKTFNTVTAAAVDLSFSFMGVFHESLIR